MKMQVQYCTFIVTITWYSNVMRKVKCVTINENVGTILYMYCDYNLLFQRYDKSKMCENNSK